MAHVGICAIRAPKNADRAGVFSYFAITEVTFALKNAQRIQFLGNASTCKAGGRGLFPEMIFEGAERSVRSASLGDEEGYGRIFRTRRRKVLGSGQWKCRPR